jgi:four helix bundle protein
MGRHNFKKLKVWNQAMELIDENYRVSQRLPASEMFGLKSQMNRSALSIASNIAEGSSKTTDIHFAKYLEISLGSAFEWETQLLVCSRQHFVNPEKFSELENRIVEIQRILSSLIKKLRQALS